ncbi:MAG: 4a-hydroxytetrahydrobiopterin dehydratase [Chloroflexi bacterium]|nr:4a-hydroxytetrahydrobiopterin dehydratase [Chloroflexota bacterium]
MAERLPESEITTALAALPGWTYDLAGGCLKRSYTFRDFVEAFGFLAQLAALQERMNHHATITNTYAQVAVQLSTHDVGGVTERDLTLARALEERALGH